MPKILRTARPLTINYESGGGRRVTYSESSMGKTFSGPVYQG